MVEQAENRKTVYQWTHAETHHHEDGTTASWIRSLLPEWKISNIAKWINIVYELRLSSKHSPKWSHNNTQTSIQSTSATVTTREIVSQIVRFLIHTASGVSRSRNSRRQNVFVVSRSRNKPMFFCGVSRSRNNEHNFGVGISRSRNTVDIFRFDISRSRNYSVCTAGPKRVICIWNQNRKATNDYVLHENWDVYLSVQWQMTSYHQVRKGRHMRDTLVNV